MVRREKVEDPRGRQWLTGGLSSDEYFDAARRSAREQAKHAIAARLHTPPSPRTA